MTDAKPYDNYEIHRQYYFEQCEPAEADIWTLYGHIPGEGLEAIGDFSSREAAEATFQRIVGIPYGDWETGKQRIRVMHATGNEQARILDQARYEQLEAAARFAWMALEDIEASKRKGYLTEAVLKLRALFCPKEAV